MSSASIIFARKRWVCTEVDVNQVTCKWILLPSELLSAMTGKGMKSPLFYTGYGKEQWSLELFPCGRNAWAKSVACFLHLVSSERMGIHAEFTISMSKSTELIAERSFTCNFDRFGGYGSNKFTERSNLVGPNSSPITISIHCKTDNVISKKRKLSFDLRINQLRDNLRVLSEDSKFSDVSVIVGNEAFPAHKSILSVRSSVFAAMFTHEEMNENRENKVRIEDMQPSVVKGMLEYIYTGGVVGMKGLASGLFQAAEKYDLEGLKGLCEEVLCDNLAINNAVETLMQAHLHGAKGLKKSVAKFIKANLYDVVQTDGYKEMSDPAVLKEIISFDVQKR